MRNYWGGCPNRVHLLTNGVDIGAANLVRPTNVVLAVDLVAHVHLGRDRREDEAFLSTIGHGELDFTIQTTGTKEGGVERVLTICRHDHLRN